MSGVISMASTFKGKVMHTRWWGTRKCHTKGDWMPKHVQESSALAEESLGVVIVPWGGDALLKASGPSSYLHGVWQLLSDKFQFKKIINCNKHSSKSLFIWCCMMGHPDYAAVDTQLCGWPAWARRLLTEDMAAIPKAEPPIWVMAALQGQRTCPVTTMGLTSVSICRGTQGTTDEQSEPKDGYFPPSLWSLCPRKGRTIWRKRFKMKGE